MVKYRVYPNVYVNYLHYLVLLYPITDEFTTILDYISANYVLFTGSIYDIRIFLTNRHEQINQGSTKGSLVRGTIFSLKENVNEGEKES